jgi:peptidoglycan/LPS O-acetylase OafA/YrhL
MKKYYFDALDGIRGAAAILVVLRHTKDYFGPLSFQESYLAVDIFYVLSGVVIANSYENRLRQGMSALDFMRIRVIRLYPLYLLAGILGTLVFMTIYPFYNVGWLFLIYVLFLPNVFRIRDGTPFPLNHPAWSLFFELVINFVYGAFVNVLGSRTLWSLCAVCAVVLAAVLAQSGDLDTGWTVRSSPIGLLITAFSFFTGVALFRVFARRDAPQIAGVTGTSLIVVCLLVVLLVLTADPRPALRPYFDFVSVVVIFPVMIHVAMRARPTALMSRLCRWAGNISYALYVLHEPTGRLMETICQAGFGVQITDFAPEAGIVFLVTLIVLCGALDRLYDVPMRKYLLTLSRRSRPVAIGLE